MKGARNPEELDVWKLADEVETRVRSLLGRRDLERDFTLWKQLKKSSESACPNIAEGFSRYLPRDFARFLRIAKASLSETIVHLGRARTKGLTAEKETAEIISLARRARGAATGLILYLETARPPRPKRPRPKRPGPKRPNPSDDPSHPRE
jgi:four helix bundle protein